MKTKTKIVITLSALCATALIAIAQDGPPQDGRPPGGPGMGGRRPMPPLMSALDANHDGVIDETEIANASNALKTLDKNGDGKLTPDELRPPRRQGFNGPGGPGGPNGPNGPRGPRGEGRPPGGPQEQN
jgi:EF hand